MLRSSLSPQTVAIKNNVTSEGKLAFIRRPKKFRSGIVADRLTISSDGCLTLGFVRVRREEAAI